MSSILSDLVLYYWVHLLIDSSVKGHHYSGDQASNIESVDEHVQTIAS